MRCEDKTAKSQFVGIAQRHAAGYLCRSCKDTPWTGRSGNKPTFCQLGPYPENLRPRPLPRCTECRKGTSSPRNTTRTLTRQSPSYLPGHGMNGRSQTTGRSTTMSLSRPTGRGKRDDTDGKHIPEPRGRDTLRTHDDKGFRIRERQQHLAEIGADISLAGVKISLSAYCNRTFGTYTTRESTRLPTRSTTRP